VCSNFSPTIWASTAWSPSVRRLRNRLVHEYIDRPDDLAPALERACQFTFRMHEDFQSIRTYAREHLLN
jgi:hypothetical protein